MGSVPRDAANWSSAMGEAPPVVRSRFGVDAPAGSAWFRVTLRCFASGKEAIYFVAFATHAIAAARIRKSGVRSSLLMMPFAIARNAGLPTLTTRRCKC